MRLVYGVGINDKKGFKKTKEYNLWVNMLARCYSNRFHLKQPTYINCSVSENFKSFSYFYDWCQNQIGFNNDGWHLDKDVLIKSNKHYSEDLCIFIPEEINKLLERRDKMRGNLPIGVSFSKAAGRYMACLSVNGKQEYIGLFFCEKDAFLAYKKRKEYHIKTIATKYKGEIDDRAYQALMMYSIDIND